MAKFHKKPVVIEAVQWFKNGDHPLDGDPKTEGGIVRYFRRPALKNDQEPCRRCSRIMHDHGWIDTLEFGHVVCPGDWIITGVKNERYPIKSDIFEKTYEAVEG